MHLRWDKMIEKGTYKVQLLLPTVEMKSYNIFRGSESLEDESEKNKSKSNIMESLGEDGNYVANISNMVAGRVGNIFGKGIGGLSTKFGGGSSSWF